jgi:hypothetical protein
MIGTIPTGQFVGSMIERVLVLVVGLYLLLLWPKLVRRRVATGKISPEAADAKLKKLRPWYGWLAIGSGLWGVYLDCSLYFS